MAPFIRTFLCKLFPPTPGTHSTSPLWRLHYFCSQMIVASFSQILFSVYTRTEVTSRLRPRDVSLYLHKLWNLGKGQWCLSHVSSLSDFLFNFLSRSEADQLFCCTSHEVHLVCLHYLGVNLTSSNQLAFFMKESLILPHLSASIDSKPIISLNANTNACFSLPWHVIGLRFRCLSSVRFCSWYNRNLRNACNYFYRFEKSWRGGQELSLEQSYFIALNIKPGILSWRKKNTRLNFFSDIYRWILKVV